MASFGNSPSVSRRLMLASCAALAAAFVSVGDLGRAAAMGGDPATIAEPTGCWSGEWRSCRSGHHGPLKATISPCGDGKYRAEFRGRFFGVFPFRYDVVLNVVGADEQGLHLAGSKHLGRLFGTFCFAATVTDCRFEATYRSAKDNGTFSMGRR
ncbi:MAG TPA: hypothetical protein PLI18_11660 [Pirellulaceae bacterium]|nr:hypothetical protein [Pirellulaceae bacterium]